MSFIVEGGGGNFERCPVGSHLARCYRIIGLGTQRSEYKGQVKFLPKVMLGWEIFAYDEDGKPKNMSDGRPFGLFKNYTLSWSEKATLRLDLQSWRGKAFTPEEMRRFDLANVMGAWCMINVVERQGMNGNTYSNVANVMPVPAHLKQLGLPEAYNKNEMFNINEPNMEMFNGFSDNLKKKIEASPEWQKILGKAAVQPGSISQAASTDDDDIPFN
jgi:hypothetical protein